MADDGRRPLDELESAVGSDVLVRLKDGEAYLGTLSGYDQHMNLVLSPSESDLGEESAATRVQDTIVIRGDNLVTINL